MISFDARELSDLAVDLGRTGAKLTPVLGHVFDEAGDQLVKTWAANARETSGAHGKHYPDSIDSERVISTDIVVEVGPNAAKPQGGMAFDSGSANQPPHLDSQRSADTEIPLLERRVISTMAHLGL